MRNLYIIFLGIVLTSGCGKTLKEGWSDFRAHYNTYYNAENDFHSGLHKVKKQPVSIDPSEPVRIHPPPVQAGNEDFKQAISKSTRIIRKFSGSKWVDDALLLIGKSYYYQQKFYQALQKFEELQNISNSPEMGQSAVLWKGRTLLDLKLNRKAISFLEAKLNKYTGDWPEEKIAGIQVLLAEHYAMLQNWDRSEQYLSQALGGMQNKKMLGRTFFLYGQVLQKLERYEDAYQAFSKVKKYFPGFEYTYWTDIKRADVERQQGKLRSALTIYERLLKDDKFFQRRDDLLFNIARTLEMQGKDLEAEKKYLLLLKKGRNTLTRILKADIYYRMGKINSTTYDNYSAAAAYFDSSSALGHAKTVYSDNDDAQKLAQLFGKYNQLQNTISHADSLLWLGSLTPAALDSVLKQLRGQKPHQQSVIKEKPAENTLKNNIDIENGGKQVTGTARYGFLNHRNIELVNRAKAEFKMVWGNRPLTDNWRLKEVVKKVSNDNSIPFTEDTQPQILSEDEDLGEAVSRIKREEIPGTDQERQKLKAQEQTAQYELGSLLFLSLNDPDKAKYHFYKVIHSKPVKQALSPRAMYSLFEIYDAEGNQDSLRYWKHQILAQYPNSTYSRRIQRSNDVLENSTQTDSTNELKLKYHKLISSPHLYKATELRTMALTHRSSDIASYIYNQAINEYIQQAHAFDALSDTLQSKLYNDTSDFTYSPEEQQFSSIYWDSVRTALAEFDTTFKDTKFDKKIAILRNTLGNTHPLTCRKLGITLKVKPSMQKFLSTVKYPDDLQNKALSGKVTYSFTVTNTGKIKSYRLISNKTALGIEEAFEQSFSHDLQFAPITARSAPDEIRCRVSFPIQR